MQLHQRIRAARAEQRLTQEALALRVGVSPRTPNRWETGKSRPRASQLPALAEALGKPVEYFEDDDPAEAAMVRAREEAAAQVITLVMTALSGAVAGAKWTGAERRSGATYVA
jgi:transcriptional regulator with XRE-family HTH domain